MKKNINRAAWSEIEVEILRENYIKVGPLGCMSLIHNRSYNTIRNQAKRLGLSAIHNNDQDRFESMYVKTDGCWEWVRGRDKSGYGHFMVGNSNIRAHRYAYKIYIGDIPGNLLVCHRCDNPACVNPEHLFLGTTQDNNADKVQKNRSVKGSTHGQAILNEEIVKEIRSSKRPASHLAKELGVNATTVKDARTGRRWKHVK